MKSVTVNR